MFSSSRTGDFFGKIWLAWIHSELFCPSSSCTQKDLFRLLNLHQRNSHKLLSDVYWVLIWLLKGLPENTWQTKWEIHSQLLHKRLGGSQDFLKTTLARAVIWKGKGTIIPPLSLALIFEDAAKCDWLFCYLILAKSFQSCLYPVWSVGCNSPNLQTTSANLQKIQISRI